MAEKKKVGEDAAEDAELVNLIIVCFAAAILYMR